MLKRSRAVAGSCEPRIRHAQLVLVHSRRTSLITLRRVDGRVGMFTSTLRIHNPNIESHTYRNSRLLVTVVRGAEAALFRENLSQQHCTGSQVPHIVITDFHLLEYTADQRSIRSLNFRSAPQT
jgi:hypothetical protein